LRGKARERTGDFLDTGSLALTSISRKGKLLHLEDCVPPTAEAIEISITSPLMTAPQRVSYRMESTLESVNKAEEMADQIASQAGMDEDTRGGISMAVREAMINAILHGNAYDPAKRVNLTFEQNGEELIVIVADQGEGFVPDEVPDPLAPENLLKQSGRGIFLMRAFMDEVRFRKLNPGTEITLIKRLQSSELDRQEAST
jgi:serine/threonine-protein kinase RsbW